MRTRAEHVWPAPPLPPTPGRSDGRGQADLVWDFTLPRVASINTSGHKYGLVYPGVGWVVWRDPTCLPDELVYRVNHLGDEMATFTLNFSRPGAQVAAQYHQFVRLGREGFTAVQAHSRDVATRLAAAIGETEPFRLLTAATSCPCSP